MKLRIISQLFQWFRSVRILTTHRCLNLGTITFYTLIIFLCCTYASAKTARHYVFFGQDREALVKAKAFFETKAAEGAQVTYSWRQLEPHKDDYDFSYIREDLTLLTSKGKKLFIQLQDVTFSGTRINVPRYLLDDPRFNGGANQQFEEAPSRGNGWVARRWDPVVQERFHKLLFALGKEFDGKVEGINLAESSIGFGKDESKFPKGFTYEAYRDGLIVNMKALKRAFPKSVTMQYANFMPGELLPADDKGYLRAIYKAARELKVGVGGPDLLPYRRGQRNHSYPLIRDASSHVPTGIAVQDGNFEDLNPDNGKRIAITELVAFATDYLIVDYIFWGTQEPYYSEQLIPFLQRLN